MGQKINPTGFRLSVNRNWGSKWYANSKNFPAMLAEDIKVREYLKKKLSHAAVGRVVIERPSKNARITIYSARPGVVIGKKGEDIEGLRNALQKLMGVPVHVNIEEIRKPELDAQLIADSITGQLEKRVMFRRAMKRAMQNAMRLGARASRSPAREGSTARRSRAPSGTARGACRCTRCARTSNTGSRRRAPPTAGSACRCSSSRARCSARASSRRLPRPSPRRNRPGNQG